MDEERRVLDTHAEAVNRVYPAGYSLYDCVSRYLLPPETIPARRIPVSVISSLTASGFREMQSAVRDYLTAIRHTGITPECHLFGLPVVEYNPQLRDTLAERFGTVLSKSGLTFWWEARKLERELGRPIGVKLSREALETVREKLERWSEGLSELKLYAIYARQQARLCGLGLSLVPDEFESGRIAPDALEDFFLKSFYRSYATHILHIGETIFFGTREEYLESRAGREFLDPRREDRTSMKVLKKKQPVRAMNGKEGKA